MSTAVEDSKDATTTFEWKPEYDNVLERIVDTDKVETAWPLLSDIIRYKISKNTEVFLGEANGAEPSPPPFVEEPSTKGGLRLQPFPAREDRKKNTAPRARLTADEAKAQVNIIYGQLAEFESAPFTIQRLCELCVSRRQHYTALGKYLRAVEKALLVTSSWDAFPPAPPAPPPGSPMPAFGARAAASFSAPTTPLFSPIPFLHEDPRRSASRSPPPLALAPASARLGDPPAPAQGELPALGLVDEMDDPGPGHMSDHPTAISSVTTVPDGPQKEEEEEPEEEAGPPAKKSKPMLGTLEDRFVSSTKEKEDEKMEVDADGDGKEKPEA